MILTRKTAALFIKLAITITMLAVVIARIDLHQMRAAIAQANLWWFVVSLLLGFIQRVFGAWQTKLDLAHFKINQSLLYVFKSQLAASFYALFLPGDLASGGITWYYLSRSSGMRAQVAALLVFLRLVNFFIVGLMAASGLLYEPKFASLHAGPVLLTFCLLTGIMILPFYFPIFCRFLQGFSSLFINHIPLHLGRLHIEKSAQSFWNSVSSYGKLSIQHTLFVCILSFGMQIFASAATLACFWAAGIPAHVETALWIFGFLVIVHSLPISIAGIGIRDISMVFILGTVFAISPEKALLFSSLILMTALIIGLLGALVVVSLGRKQ
jgi:uncharacterized membrane protein YbhN (UPF0104 family)